MLSDEMQRIVCHGFGSPDIMRLEAGALPTPDANQLLIKVAAAGVNRADLMQRRGKYPPPPGASDILGLEVAGTIVGLGPKARRWRAGDRVCALLAGGGYAEYAVAPETHCLPVPSALSLTEAAVLPEAIVTVYANLFETGGLKAGDTVLIHGGASGIGSMAIQMAKAAGASVVTTVGSPGKMEACYALGADFTVNYHNEDFVEAARRATNGRGVQSVLDMVGGSYINRNLAALATHGRHISIAAQENGTASLDLRLIMQKRLILTGSTLRGRDPDEKARLIGEIERKIWPWLVNGRIKPVLGKVFPLKNAADAHKLMESGVHIGKIALEVS